MNIVILFLFLGFLGSVEMAYLDLNSFFNVSGNLTQITWAHAVNNQSLLTQALDSPKVMMLEADVVIGTLNGTNKTNIPIMAHPPANTSDLSLENFLAKVNDHNKNNNTSGNKKGIKLDFKSIEALEDSVHKIQELYENMSYPVWINADILAGPHQATTIPVNPTRFFNATESFKNSTLSIGWTTKVTPNVTASYTKTNVEEMLTIVKNFTSPGQSITYPVRAIYAASSVDQLKDLVRNENSTLTIWSGDGDVVNVANLKNLIKKIGLKKTYIDVPEELQKQLDLGSIGGGGASTPLVGLVVSVLALLLFL